VGVWPLGQAGVRGLVSCAAGGTYGTSGFTRWSAVGALLGSGTAADAVFVLIALRTIGFGLLMMTLALGQIVWGVAFRYTDLTNGDNGISLGRASVISADPLTLYYVCLAVLALVMVLLAAFIRSPLGAAIKGVRDQPRRMSTLGYNTWAIRYVAYLVSGFVATVSGILYVQIFQYISPHALSLTVSSEAVLMVIAGGIGTLFGPLLGAGVVVLLKNVASAYTDRWPPLLGCIFLFIIIPMPEGLLPGSKRILAGMIGSFRKGAAPSASLQPTSRAR
ncbi:branched-chain amino acid ABC transporter permease, partial [Neorhizobium galegae]|uniref:branched-chain amino acid ABC transporter permease n=1 Tax=Neorhizobium galegae TaxID=399 RepID=UPI002101DB13